MTSAWGRASADDDPTPWLRPDELAVLRERGTVRRQRDRIAGRIAAKRALHELTGVDPLSIDVPRAESGEPLARVPGHSAVAVSLSHTDGGAVAIAVRSGRVGVDRERIEPRPEAFLQMWLSDAERTLAVDAVAQNVIWSTKEAVLKVLGTGMAIAPRHVQVEAIDDTTVRVRLDGSAADRAEEVGGRPVLTWWREPGFVVVLARIPGLASQPRPARLS